MEGCGERKKGVVVVVAKTPDRNKRDEWSEGGVTSLLDAYEAKWLLRNRAKLKGSDWEDISRQVSARGSGTKPVKTPNQCKNKIEAMKKRYRTESTVNNHSGSAQPWQFYDRIDRLVKGTHCLQPKIGDVVANGVVARTLGLQALPNIAGDLENDTKKLDGFGLNYVQAVEEAQNFKTIDVDGQVHVQDSNQDDGSNMVPNNSEFSTLGNKAADIGERFLKINSVKRKKSFCRDVAESFRMLAHSMLKIEQARMEIYRESERLRAEAEIKRAEMDLKRTEIIAKTQLQIAEIFVKRVCIRNNKSRSSSLVAGNIVPTNVEEKYG
ncbi:Trihelix transcription factor [Actinidia chinensis var. chinensis]|uniref:Trihelix transcription factor n=1 Tax=Actinidia chinensis var. chinensis TaxID=1590841 RepID=A0A2R6QF41_ACTCC|nr:Trihelix transcription factor [Actinidia chinensis var. chinensis]